jgi:hypothetical protein
MTLGCYTEVAEAFENRVLRRIFGTEMVEVIRRYRKLSTEV